MKRNKIQVYFFGFSPNTKRKASFQLRYHITHLLKLQVKNTACHCMDLNYLFHRECRQTRLQQSKSMRFLVIRIKESCCLHTAYPSALHTLSPFPHQYSPPCRAVKRRRREMGPLGVEMSREGKPVLSSSWEHPSPSTAPPSSDGWRS